jgi:hypothetical protein
VIFQVSCFYNLFKFVQCRYEKLHRWDEALRAYNMKSSQASGPLQNLDATLGRIITSFLLCCTLLLQRPVTSQLREIVYPDTLT